MEKLVLKGMDCKKPDSYRIKLWFHLQKEEIYRGGHHIASMSKENNFCVFNLTSIILKFENKLKNICFRKYIYADEGNKTFGNYHYNNNNNICSLLIIKRNYICNNKATFIVFYSNSTK